MSSVTPDEKLAAELRRYSPSPSRDPDAGLRAVSHYERKLPKWRYQLRQRLIPIVRWETPYLAKMQDTLRSPLLDSYFAFTANLGTHTFFMTFLPICFWCGYPNVGMALVHMLGLGVYASGALKDLICLPRPLSPPLNRITMSGSAALEYGFPSTHTTNAVSVALFFLYQLHESANEWSPTSYRVLSVLCYWYAMSITLGRMYCGMHGFFDVIVGAILGTSIALLRVVCGPIHDKWILEGGIERPALSILALALMVRFHPEPADNCPCFDDSVAFLGVIMGITIGTWTYYQHDAVKILEPSLPEMYPYTNQDLLKSAARLISGIIVIFLWRAIMKPLLLSSLPPIFRFVDHYGVRLPRRYFLQARDYTQVPPLQKDDNVLPSASEIPSIISSFRYPRRRRVSVGPQSEADARELLATRRKDGRPNRSPRRRAGRKPQTSTADEKGSIASEIEEERSEGEADNTEQADQNTTANPTASLQIKPANQNLLTPPTSDAGGSSDSDGENQRTREVFSAIEKPRKHYDVEVITKLVVYAGISWLVVEGNPILFQYLGLV